MIYICVPSYNNAETVGLVLWKVRQVLGEFEREYHLLVSDDGSDDATAEVLESYEQALPMSVVTHPTRLGYATSVDELLQDALNRTDRPKRDCAVVLNADFSVSPAVVPELLRRVESGADVVVAQATRSQGGWATRLVRRMATNLLRPGLQVPGVRDLLSGVCAIRLVTLKRSLRDRRELLDTDGVPARAELIARTAAVARQVATVSVNSMHLRPPAIRDRPIALALQLFRAGRTLNVPPPQVAAQEAI